MKKAFDPEKFKSIQREAWSSVAEGWLQGHAPSLLPVSDHLIRFVGIPKDARVLDIACGAGTLALAAVKAGAAEVTAADLAPGFRPVVEKIAQEAGMKERIRFQECDLEHLPFEDRRFDVVLCQFGLMFATNRKTAFREIYRSLKPQGSFGGAVWCSAEQNEALASILQLVQDHLPPRPDGAPSLFECGTPNLMSGELHSVGFRDYQETTVDLLLRYDNLESAIRASRNTGPFAAAYGQWDSKTRRKVKDRIKKIYTGLKTSRGTIEMPSRALLFQAKRGFETLQP